MASTTHTDTGTRPAPEPRTERTRIIHARLNRRAALGLLGTAGAAIVAGCGSSPTSPTTTTTDTTTTTGGTTTGGGTTSSGCPVTPTETSGPYPDQTGMLNNTAFLRQDVTEGQTGLPLVLTLTVVNTKNSCAAVSGAKIEIWQCNAQGNYSEYAQPGYNGTGQTFLRGLQTTDTNGVATFRTIYPGWYSGRATHIHFEVYVNNVSIKVSQIAFPENVSAAVYATGVYASKGQNSITNATDNVFSDGVSTQLATLMGDPSSGYTATLTVGVSI